MATQYTQLHIEGDPTVWTLTNPVADPAEISAATAPLALEVISPLVGILLLSVQAAAFVTLLPPSAQPPNPSPMGWIPGDAQAPSTFLYLPSTSVPAARPVCYQMPENVSVSALQASITSAMAGPTTIAVEFEVAGSAGQVVINGAALPFAVIGPPDLGQ